jgi:hypothetical protein
MISNKINYVTGKIEKMESIVKIIETYCDKINNNISNNIPAVHVVSTSKDSSWTLPVYYFEKKYVIVYNHKKKCNVCLENNKFSENNINCDSILAVFCENTFGLMKIIRQYGSFFANCDAYENIHRFIRNICPEYIIFIVCESDIIVESIFESQANKICNNEYKSNGSSEIFRYNSHSIKYGYNNGEQYKLFLFKKEKIIVKKKYQCLIL